MPIYSSVSAALARHMPRLAAGDLQAAPASVGNCRQLKRMLLQEKGMEGTLLGKGRYSVENIDGGD